MGKYNEGPINIEANAMPAHFNFMLIRFFTAAKIQTGNFVFV